MNGLAYFKPTGLVRSSTAVAPGFSGGGATLYPTIANSLLWIDYANSYTDASGLTPATEGQSVQTIRLPSGWGASLGTGMVSQSNGISKPVYRSGDGLESQNTNTLMALPASISLTGAFTVYTVVNFHEVATAVLISISGRAASFGGVLNDIDAGNVFRAYSEDLGYFQSQAYTATGLKMLRQRRNAANAIFFAGTGLAEVAKSSSSYTWLLQDIFRRDSGVSGSTEGGVCIAQVVVVDDDTVTAGTDAAIQAALIAKTPGLTGI